jgi:O-antigen/teichoic acid export membrane protein
MLNEVAECQTEDASLSSWVQRIQQPFKDLLDGESLKAKAFRGGAWLGGAGVVEQLFRFGRNMLLTRLLAPEAFGMMAIVLSIGASIENLTEVGIKDSLIQNSNTAEKNYLNAAFWLALSRAIAIYSGVFLLAPWIGKFYGNTELTPLLRVSLLTTLFSSAISPRAYLAIKKMKFKKWVMITNGSGILGVILTVTLSYFIRGVWALVIGSALQGAMMCVLSYAVCPFLPSFRFNRDAARDLLKFSRGMFGLTLLNFIFQRTDIFVLAKMFTPTQLGLYTIAVYLAQTPVGFLINIMNQVFLPSFTHVQDNNFRTNRIYMRVATALILVGMPVLVFVFFCGHSILTLAYGARYGAVALPFLIASCVAFLNTLNLPITSAFYARGTPQLHRRCVATMAVATIVLIYPFAKVFGIAGGQMACLAALAIGYLFQVIRMHDMTGLDLTEYGKKFLYGAAVALGVVVICVAVKPFAALSRPIPNIAFGILGCIVAYSLAYTFFSRDLRKVD